MTISNEVIEAAADAAESIYESWGSWEAVARAVLEAAAPIIRAECLEEAADAQDADPNFRDPLRLKSDWLRARAAAVRGEG